MARSLAKLRSYHLILNDPEGIGVCPLNIK